MKTFKKIFKNFEFSCSHFTKTVVYISEGPIKTKGGVMEDKSIIALYYQRNEKAIEESSRKYNRYCQAIAFRILENQEDAEECVLDTWMKAWNSIPPDKPISLAAYFGTITRHLSLDYLKRKSTKTRGGKEVDLVFHELESILEDNGSPEKTVENNELSELLNRFLATLSERDRNILLCRYYLVYPVRIIAKNHQTTAKHIQTILARTLAKLKDFLAKENYL